MKAARISLIIFSVLILSCSKDDDPQPLSKASISLGSSGTIVQAPAGLTSSSDPYAQQVAGYFELVNEMSDITAAFKVPAGATKLSGKITPINGRIASETVTYTWIDDGTEVAYQVTDDGVSHIFELLFKLPDTDDWIKYVSAEEKKDKSHGTLKLYDAFGLLGDDLSAVLVEYEWTLVGDDLTFKYTSFGEFSFTLHINTKTKVGDVDYYIGDIRYYRMTWDAAGHGTWNFYDETGDILESGTW